MPENTFAMSTGPRRARMTVRAVVLSLATFGGLLTGHGARASAPDNSATSLDWEGTYTGVLPCADCAGIETAIRLNRDGTYLLEARYLGKDREARQQRGNFSWNSNGSSIELLGIPSAPNRYFVGENTLTQLDRDGSRITGDLAGRYVLNKTAGAAPADDLFAASGWRLTELAGKPVTETSGPRKPVTVTFEHGGNRVYGFAGCNRFTGAFEYAAENHLRISKVAATQMACLDMTMENDFLQMLATVESFDLKDHLLVLNRARTAPLARFTAVQ